MHKCRDPHLVRIRTRHSSDSAQSRHCGGTSVKAGQAGAIGFVAPDSGVSLVEHNVVTATAVTSYLYVLYHGNEELLGFHKTARFVFHST